MQGALAQFPNALALLELPAGNVAVENLGLQEYRIYEAVSH